MRDRFGRTINYARLSVTDRCSLRCRYCMGPEGGPWLDRLLSDGELLAVCRCLASLGVTRFRITGGEPLCRPGLPGLIAQIKDIPGVETVAMTTNGVELVKYLPALLDAGLDGINLSLDTLDRDRFLEVTRRDALGDALAGLYAAMEYRTLNVKVNCVTAPGRERDWIDLARLAALSRKRPVSVRFIEPMPIGPGAGLPPCGETEALSALEAAYGPAVPLRQADGIGPARYVRFPGFTGKIGFISPVSRPFCAACNRVRVTADGFLRTCLYAPDGIDLLPLLAGPEDILREAVTEAVRRKPEGHRFAQGEVVTGTRMNRIGG